MRLPHLLLALCPALLCACSTAPLTAPAKVNPPPVLLTMECLVPENLPDTATGQDLAVWVIGWMDAFWCERDRRAALVDAWPK